MKKAFVLIFLLIALPANAQVMQGVGTGVAGSAAAEYTALSTANATEVDVPANITLTSATQVSWTEFPSRIETGYVYQAINFTGDFTVRFTVNTTAQDASSLIAFWGLSKNIEDMYAIDSGSDESDDGIFLGLYNGDFKLYLFEDGVGSSDTDAFVMATSTEYFITVTRDDDAGANSAGQYKAYICTTAYCTSGGNLQDTLTLDSAAGEQNDFSYIYWVSSYNAGSLTITHTGYTKNLEYKLSL